MLGSYLVFRNHLRRYQLCICNQINFYIRSIITGTDIQNQLYVDVDLAIAVQSDGKNVGKCEEMRKRSK